MRPACLLLALALLPACASHVLIPPDERSRLERELTGRDRERFLRLSYYVTPFFGDTSKRLLTPLLPDEVRLVDHPSGGPVNPGPIEKVLPAGSRARIAAVEFPTSFVIAGRVLYTPRTQPWVYLEIEGMPAHPPLVLVLRPQLKSGDELTAEIDRYLSRQDPAAVLAGFSEAVREAVRTKSALIDMPAAALEMAWGYPELKRVSFEADSRKEDWSWPGHRRAALLVDDRVVKLEGAGKAAP